MAYGVGMACAPPTVGVQCGMGMGWALPIRVAIPGVVSACQYGYGLWAGVGPSECGLGCGCGHRLAR